jgi:hypothetical protein
MDIRGPTSVSEVRLRDSKTEQQHGDGGVPMKYWGASVSGRNACQTRWGTLHVRILPVEISQTFHAALYGIDGGVKTAAPLQGGEEQAQAARPSRAGGGQSQVDFVFEVDIGVGDDFVIEAMTAQEGARPPSTGPFTFTITPSDPSGFSIYS